MTKEEIKNLTEVLAGEKPVEGVTAFIDGIIAAHSDELTELKRIHATEVKDLKAAYATEVNDLKNTAAEEVNSLKETYEQTLLKSTEKLASLTREVPGTFSAGKGKVFRFKRGHLKVRISAVFNHKDSPLKNGDIVLATELMSNKDHKGILENLVKLGAGIIEEVEQ